MALLAAVLVVVAAVQGTNLRRLTPDRLASGLRAPTWSPDGKQIAFTVGESVYVMKADGADLRMLARGGDDQGGTPLAWQPPPT